MKPRFRVEILVATEENLGRVLAFAAELDEKSINFEKIVPIAHDKNATKKLTGSVAETTIAKIIGDPGDSMAKREVVAKFRSKMPDAGRSTPHSAIIYMLKKKLLRKLPGDRLQLVLQLPQKKEK
jgi:hypothetical protein